MTAVTICMGCQTSFEDHNFIDTWCGVCDRLHYRLHQKDWERCVNDPVWPFHDWSPPGVQGQVDKDLYW